MRLLLDLIRQIRFWDLPSRVALMVALIFLIFSLLLAVVATDEIRRAAIIVAFGLVIVLQLIIMWGNRGMVTPYIRARQLFIAGDFQAARDILETELADEKKRNGDALTLLGNVYRNLGELDQSEKTLRQALAISPDYYFPLYGLGRTLLAKGEYQEAITAIEKALHKGAPEIIKFDLGHCRYRSGSFGEAISLFKEIAPAVDEVHRMVMIHYILHRIADYPPPDALIIQQGVAYWEREAKLFELTSYGRVLAQDIDCMRQLAGLVE